MATVTYPTLEHVAMEGRPYPVDELEGCKTGLVLFAAAFLGHNDAIHFAEAGIQTMCVDIDGVRLAEMAQLYPRSWQWAMDDAWKFADAAYTLGEMWDAVSVDTFTGDMERRSLDSLELWCSLATRVVTVTVTKAALGSYEVPEGWQEALHARSETVYWLVLTRA